MNRAGRTALPVGLAWLGGCGALSFLLPNQTTVVLRNLGDFPVEADVRIADQQEIPEFLLKEVGEKLTLMIPAGGTQSFFRKCDDLQALILEDADLRIVGGLGPETNTDVLRDGDDFSCGSTVTMTFSHSILITDFDVNVSVANRQLLVPVPQP